MIIKYYSNGAFEVDKTTCATNNFALAQYEKDSRTLLFKANVVVEGHTMLLTHSQVTKLAKSYFCWSDGVARAKWLKNNFRKIELAIKAHLSKRNYKGEVKVRLLCSWNSLDLFKDLGYVHVTNNTRVSNNGWYQTLLVEKTI